MKSLNPTSFLLGAIAVMLATLVFRAESPAPVFADTALGNGIAAISITQQNQSYLAVIDNNKRMAVYFINNNGLRLLTSRNIEFDLAVDFFDFKGTRQEPTVQEMKATASGGSR